MTDKFKYAPGMPGFGTKGSDGSTGNQGLAMYFTDLDPVTEIILLNTKIENDWVLWEGSSTSLPDGRPYTTGDLFFDSNGKAYEINAETNTFSSIGGNLNMGGFFVPLGINADNGFQRYFNSNSSPKYIIDNIYTEVGAINYTGSPLTIYGITSENFARIEFSNVVLGQYNPFTVYSSGVTGGIDDASAIAIVRDVSLNLFRIGNLDDAGNLRNVNLVFDVSSLIHTKQPGNYFNPSTAQGSILTNYEIAANSLFDPNFNSNPASFIGVMGTTDISISWNLLDFTNDSLVTGDLYFYEDLFPVYNGSTFRIDSSAARPLIFSHLDSSSSIHIIGVSPIKAYGCYMKLTKNGWTRNSASKNLFASSLAVTPLSYSDVSAAETSIGFNVITNIGWDVSLYNNPGNFMSIWQGICPSGGNLSHPYDGSVYIHLASNALSTVSRTGYVKILNLLGGTFQNVSIQQKWGIQPQTLPTLISSFYAIPRQSPTIPYPGQSGIRYITDSGKSNYVWTITPDSGMTVAITSGGLTTDSSITVTWGTPGGAEGTGSVTVHYTDGGGISSNKTLPVSIEHFTIVEDTNGASYKYYNATTGAACQGNNTLSVYINPGNTWHANVVGSNSAKVFLSAYDHTDTRYPSVSGETSNSFLSVNIDPPTTSGSSSDIKIYSKHSLSPEISIVALSSCPI
jgi:hypothetical protein